MGAHVFREGVHTLKAQKHWHLVFLDEVVLHLSVFLKCTIIALNKAAKRGSG